MVPFTSVNDAVVALARAPLRVSLAGGGTDLPSHARRHGGLVISVAINRYVSVAVFPRSFDGRLQARWDEIEWVADAGELTNRFARAALARVGPVPAAQLSSFSDAPSRTGLGSSAAFTVALLHALRQGEKPEPTALAEEASAVEMVDLARPVGKHDHYMAAFGGARALHIDRDLSVTVRDVPMAPEVRAYLEHNLLLFHTGTERDAGAVLAEQHARTDRGEVSTVAALHGIHELTSAMAEAVGIARVDRIGPLLARHWELKKQLSPAVSTPRVDALYAGVMRAGADGGKLLGGGGGGFLLVSAPTDRIDAVRAAMTAKQAPELTFGLDETGSQVTTLPV